MDIDGNQSSNTNTNKTDSQDNGEDSMKDPPLADTEAEKSKENDESTSSTASSGSDDDSSSDENEDDNNEEEEEEEELIPKVLPLRTTRKQYKMELKKQGLTVNDAGQQEEEADEQFWDQDAWQELSDDDEVRPEDFGEDEVGDSSDSDIDLNEEEEDATAAAAEAEAEANYDARGKGRGRGRKRFGVYVDPAFKTTKKRQKKDPNASGSATSSTSTATTLSSESRSLRTSTVLQKNSRDSQTSNQQQQAKKKVQRVKETPYTQQQLLEEAAKTEIENRQSLERMLLLEAEKKKMMIQSKTKLTGPRIIFRSRIGYPDTITYIDQ